MLVFTQGWTSIPSARAFFAISPAPTMTDGLDVLVQLVIAATTIVPSPISTVRPSISILTALGVRAATAVPPPVSAPPPLSENPLGTRPGRSRAKAGRTLVRSIRSCGRFGPATLGSIEERSSSSVAVYSGSGVSSVRKSPCSRAIRPTRSTSAGLLPVPCRYRSVSSSTGKKPTVAPYSGDMLASVALSGRLSPDSPAP